MNQIEIPRASGSYRWYYVDVASGPYTAVFIFMIGSVFSARYSRALKRGAVPGEHAAINFALYENGNRVAWALSEYPHFQADERSLRIGRSELRYTSHGLRAEIHERTAPFFMTGWGSELNVQLELTNEGPSLDEVTLVEGLSHAWRPIAPRARATVKLEPLGLRLEGRAYHDGNHGLVPLGTDLKGWEWVRVHDEARTSIVYRPWSAAPAIVASISQDHAHSHRQHLPEEARTRSAWGLRVPSSLGVRGQPRWMESSPFYARGEASFGCAHALGEVADFARFHSPVVRWMADFRTRAEAPP